MCHSRQRERHVGVRALKMVERRGHIVGQAALKQGAELPLQIVVGAVD